MKYNSPHATASWGAMAKDWEQGIDYSRLSKERLARAQAAIRHAGLGGVLAFNFDNIRYLTATHIGEWARDKFFRYALCPAEGKPFLWDPAPPAKRISSPWIADNVAAPITTMQGAIPPSMNVQHDFAKQVKKALVHYGIAKEPLGIDILEIGMLRALEAEGIEVVDGQQAMLDAREIKTADEIELLKLAAAMVDATYVDIARAIRPGTKENEHMRKNVTRRNQYQALVALGAVAVLGNACSFLLVNRAQKINAASGWKTPVQAAWSEFMLKNVASRDFSVIVLIAALLGKLDWFLWMASAGSLVFTALMLWVVRPSATSRA